MVNEVNKSRLCLDVNHDRVESVVVVLFGVPLPMGGWSSPALQWRWLNPSVLLQDKHNMVEVNI